MDGKGPPKTAVILATPVNVEESRAQRLQRQQSRFRDRGGIFIPSSRSTLANILLGKASPLKRPQRRSRSASASPCKAKSHAKAGKDFPMDLDPVVLKASSRRSPQKQGRKSIQVAEDDKGPERKPKTRKSVGAAKKSKQVVQDSTKPAPPTKVATTKASKVPDATEASTSKRKIKESDQLNVENIIHADDSAKVVPKAKSKTKAASFSKPSAAKTTVTKEPSKSIPKASISKASESALSVVGAEASKTARSRPRRSSDLHSGGSEDEYVPKQSTNSKKTTVKTKQTVPAEGATSRSSKAASKPFPPAKGKKKENAQLPDIGEEDEEGEEEVQVPRIAVVTKENVVQSTAKPDKKGKKRLPPDVDLDEEAHEPPKKRSKKNDKATANEAEPDPKAKAKVQKNATKATTKSPRKPELKEDVDVQELEPSAARRKKVRNESELKAPTKPIKKPPREQGLEKEAPMEEPTRKKAGDSKSKALKKTTKKRPRNHDPEEEAPLEEPTERDSKRKKVADGKAKATKPKAKVAQPKKPATKARPKASSANEAMRPLTNATKPIESNSAPVRSKTKRGPPKSVLQRIQNSQPDETDNEPDPIDFLS